ncbi:MAG: S-layer homology domain-containing protein [Lachnospiraceae bacterium]
MASDSWYGRYVYSAVELGLVDGITETTYGPDESFTLAQAIKIARLHDQLYHDGAVTP